MATTNFQLRAVLDGKELNFEYEAQDLREVLQEFWYNDYPETDCHGEFPIDVINGGVCAPLLFNSALFHAFFDNGFKWDGPYVWDDFYAHIREGRKELDNTTCILTATVAGYGHTFEYGTDNVWKALEEFFRSDHAELDGSNSCETYPVEVKVMTYGKAKTTYSLQFCEAVFHAYFCHGDKPYALHQFAKDIKMNVKA